MSCLICLNAVYSIDWAQQMAGLSKISNHLLVSLMVSAFQRLLGRPKVENFKGAYDVISVTMATPQVHKKAL